MPKLNVIVSVCKNTLKLSVITPTGFKSHTSEISSEVVNDCLISDPTTFSATFVSVLSNLGVKPSQVSLAFLAEPSHVFHRFLSLGKSTTSNSSQDIGALLISEVKEKYNSEFDVSNAYFHYEKIAPFLFKFTAVAKDYLENIMDFASKANVSLDSVISYVDLLPKYLNINDSAVLAIQLENRLSLALTEFGSVFYTSYAENKEKPFESLKSVENLSFYKRTRPTNKIFTLNYDFVSLKDKFDIRNIEVPNSAGESTMGFEMHLITHFCIDAKIEMSESSDLLNLLPLPAVSSKAVSLASVGRALPMVMMALVFLGLMYVRRDAFKKPLQPTDVLSSTNQTTQTTTSQTSTSNGGNHPTTTAELKKFDLKVKVENASGVNGLAGRTKEFLTEKGYTVVEINTADVDKSSTLFNFKKGKEAYKDVILKDLEGKVFDVVVDTALDPGADYDLLIVAGNTSKI